MLGASGCWERACGSSRSPCSEVEGLKIHSTVDSKKLEYGPETIFAGFPCSPVLGVGGQSSSNFLASTVYESVSLPSCIYLRVFIYAESWVYLEAYPLIPCPNKENNYRHRTILCWPMQRREYRCPGVETRQDSLGAPTDAALEAMPNAPPKRFLPRLHVQYQSLGKEEGLGIRQS